MRREWLAFSITLLIVMPRGMCACQLAVLDSDFSAGAVPVADAKVLCCPVGTPAANQNADGSIPLSAPDQHHSECPGLQSNADDAAVSKSVSISAINWGLQDGLNLTEPLAFRLISSAEGQEFGRLTSISPPLFITHCVLLL